MRQTFHPYLPNGPRGDPVLWVDLPDEGHSILVDLGDLRSIAPRRLLRVDRVIVSRSASLLHLMGAAMVVAYVIQLRRRRWDRKDSDELRTQLRRAEDRTKDQARLVARMRVEQGTVSSLALSLPSLVRELNGR